MHRCAGEAPGLVGWQGALASCWVLWLAQGQQADRVPLPLPVACLQREATVTAGRIAGLDTVRIIR